MQNQEKAKLDQEVVVTEAMIKAGLKVLYRSGILETELRSDALVVEEIARAILVAR